MKKLILLLIVIVMLGCSPTVKDIPQPPKPTYPDPIMKLDKIEQAHSVPIKAVEPNYIYKTAHLTISDEGVETEQYLYAIKHESDGTSKKYVFNTYVSNNTHNIMTVSYQISLIQCPANSEPYVSFSSYEATLDGGECRVVNIPVSLDSKAKTGLYVFKITYWLP